MKNNIIAHLSVYQPQLLFLHIYPHKRIGKMKNRLQKGNCSSTKY